MFLMFGPMMSITVVSFIAALGIMISIHPLLTLVALIPIPGVYWVGLSMRSKLFPLSWVIQARQADVATIVEENVTGVRIVKSFAAEKQQLGLLGHASERDRKSTRLNSSHALISYAVFCLKKKKNNQQRIR